MNDTKMLVVASVALFGLVICPVVPGPLHRY